jgi:hypothetical protein
MFCISTDLPLPVEPAMRVFWLPPLFPLCENAWAHSYGSSPVFFSHRLVCADNEQVERASATGVKIPE